MNYYALFYQVVDDYIIRRAEYRDEHLTLAKKAYEKGHLILAGAFSDPPDGALLVFKASDKSVVEDFVKNDPYANNGLVTNWEIREWTVVIGSDLD